MKISSGDELANCVKWKKQNKDKLSTLSDHNKAILSQIWKTSNDDPISLNYATKVNQYMPISKKNHFNDTASKILKLRSVLESKFPIDPDKWATPSLQEVKEKHRRWSEIIQCKSSKIDKICDGLYCISQK